MGVSKKMEGKLGQADFHIDSKIEGQQTCSSTNRL